MSQPFRNLSKENDAYLSRVWPGLEFRHCRNGSEPLGLGHIVMNAPCGLETLSGAPYGGGFGRADRIINAFVPKTFDCADPVAHIDGLIGAWGYAPERTIGLLTAANIALASIAEAEGDQAAIVCCTTAGTSNGARAGKERPVFSAYAAGTINTIVAIDGRLTQAAMAGALITATEAKSAAFQDLGIVDAHTGEIATGTTTDTVAIAASQSERFAGVHRYAGSATTLGNLLGRLVYETVYEAVRTQGELT
ncbi:adenosylcobinamide amidohydrolase [Paenibacillus sp. MSJ-34]|uniref:adenosylcobinamide amidohydrolase n=1 Tax=Paenibacillus sp. MSJ-34 TaxID=2841529 RepID=UPI001C10ED98|nr:adenosylcobinamide amidohydrolase [Paenibacillus sp. MSJ-34]MBU5443866.1 adenosylcobinamide amidohydrolase [Paenibacillus sp. MSJ-34]